MELTIDINTNNKLILEHLKNIKKLESEIGNIYQRSDGVYFLELINVKEITKGE